MQQQPATHLQVAAWAEQVTELGQQAVEETAEGPTTSI